MITPSAPIPAGADFKVQIKYVGRPGVHVDGDGATEGWFRNNTPVGDGGFMTTEPVGSMAWMPLNNHPTVKPTYEFWSTTNWDSTTGTGRTAISNGRLIGFTDNATDPQFPANAASPNGGSRTWHWKSPEPIANYLVENSHRQLRDGRARVAQRHDLLHRSGRRDHRRPQGDEPGDR